MQQLLHGRNIIHCLKFKAKRHESVEHRRPFGSEGWGFDSLRAYFSDHSNANFHDANDIAGESCAAQFAATIPDLKSWTALFHRLRSADRAALNAALA